MAVEAGTKLAQYRLVEKIGEGGMGVVWKAVDTTLDREVAIKVLPELFSVDPDRLLRFEREAKLLASMNHPNIATVHGLHRAPATDGGPEVRFLALELVEGEDLAVRLQRGPLPIDETIAVAIQVASALEAAHAQGIVHRDLKPANVALAPDGKAKVLDFGLAKAMEPDAASGSGSRSLSPTVTSAGTAAGVILGTAAYMSPEQARGRPVDRRTDIWSFGCVLYECLTGTVLFRGETVSDSLAAILRKDVDWSTLPAGTPPLLRLLLRRCLTREPAKRLQDAGDVRIELELAKEDPQGAALGLGAAGDAPAAAAGDGAARPHKSRAWLPWTVAALAVVVASIFALRGLSTRPDAPDFTRRLRIDVPGATGFGTLRAAPPVISPDGRKVVFGVAGDNGEINLWVRSLDDFNLRPLPNTRNAAFAFWSADSRHVGYFDTVKLKRIEVSTGRIQTIGGKSSAFPRGGSWNAAGQVLYVPDSNSGVHLIEAAGGQGRQITTPDPNVPDYSHRWPSFLPDGAHFLFTGWTNDLRARPEHAGIFLASIAGNEEPVRIIPDASSVVYAPPGYILFVRDGNLIVVPFDAEELRVTGEARVIASGLLYNQGTAYGVFSASHEGTLVYARGTATLPANLTWYGRDGSSTAAAGEPAPFDDLRLSPSADRAAVTIPGESGDDEIWILDLERGVRTRLQNVAWSCTDPIWSGAGDRVLYASQQTGMVDFEAVPADGAGDPVSIFADDNDKQPYDWSRDGRYIAYWPQGFATSGTADIWIHSAETKTVTPLITGDSTYQDARFSPDGRFIAYVSDDSSRLEVYVQQLVMNDGVKGGARWQLSTSGGTRPHWRSDGREIVYVDPKQQVTAVSVEPQGDRLKLGTPRVLFRIDGRIVTLDAAGDHQRFLVATQDGPDSEPLHVVLNWTADLK